MKNPTYLENIISSVKAGRIVSVGKLVADAKLCASWDSPTSSDMAKLLSEGIFSQFSPKGSNQRGTVTFFSLNDRNIYFPQILHLAQVAHGDAFACRVLYAFLYATLPAEKTGSLTISRDTFTPPFGSSFGQEPDPKWHCSWMRDFMSEAFAGSDKVAQDFFAAYDSGSSDFRVTPYSKIERRSVFGCQETVALTYLLPDDSLSEVLYEYFRPACYKNESAISDLVGSFERVIQGTVLKNLETLDVPSEMAKILEKLGHHYWAIYRNPYSSKSAPLCIFLSTVAGSLSGYTSPQFSTLMAGNMCADSHARRYAALLSNIDE